MALLPTVHQTHPAGLIPFPFALPPCAACLSAFFFPVFLLEKVTRSEARQDCYRWSDGQKIRQVSFKKYEL
ncbi:hypothetical protein NU09_1948 [Flavobacterium beibuense]|uniref:Uncharacterized protein n=1 Tax=Flavobacterium beibuense TaxID=657326 RepID=A0A444WAC0_9FLAO|nr:hypothetical protein NU09_1948 [Flavobacterium beibuense]